MKTLDGFIMLLLKGSQPSWTKYKAWLFFHLHLQKTGGNYNVTDGFAATQSWSKRAQSESWAFLSQDEMKTFTTHVAEEEKFNTNDSKAE